jgi:predicted transcriptional regulator
MTVYSERKVAQLLGISRGAVRNRILKAGLKSPLSEEELDLIRNWRKAENPKILDIHRKKN